MTAPTLHHDTYNVSSGHPVTNREFAAAVQGAVPGSRVDPTPGREHGSGPDHPYLDITRLTTDTGFTPHYDVATAVDDYVRWRTSNPR